MTEGEGRNMETHMKPILFSSSMVRAILEGRKAVTRRVITVPWHKGKRCLPYEPWYVEEDGKLLYQNEYGEYRPIEAIAPYRPGDVLWVRETWFPDPPDNGEWDFYMFTDGEIINLNAIPEEYRNPKHVIYRASWNSPFTGWRPSIHMPRWASRISLSVLSVRAGRLQEITEEEAIKEGIQRTDAEGMKDWPWLGADHPIKGTPKVFASAKQAFESLWDSINGKRCPWASNPWVWVIEFDVVPKELSRIP